MKSVKFSDFLGLKRGLRVNKKRIYLLVISIILVILPTSLKATTIYDVQHNETNRGDYPDCYPSPKEDSTVTITGVVTGITENTSYDNFWIQEASGLWYGIYVFDNYIHPSRGDSITLAGLIQEYYGVTEIDPDPDAHQILATGVSEPEPIKVTSAELVGGCSATGESYEGVLVRMESVVVTQDLNGYGEWYISDDGGATECQIDDKCFHYDPTIGDSIHSITGVVTYHYDEYEINPRDFNDIVLPGAIPPVIWNTTHTPSSPTSNDTVTVTTKVTDDVIVASVWLFYFIVEAQFDSVKMLDDGLPPDITAADSIYTTQILPQELGTKVKYYIKAWDDPALVTTDPINAPDSSYSYTVLKSGDGSGSAIISPTTVATSQVVTETLTVVGEGTHTLAQVGVNIPNSWIWTGSYSDVTLSGNGFSGCTLNIEGNTISVSGASVTDENTGVIAMANLTTPQTSTISTFVVKTAVTNGTLTEIASSPRVTVQGETITSIADIQDNPSEYVGKVVTVRGVVTIGAGVIDSSMLRAYVQDNSGKGINVFDFDLSFTSELVRGYLVTVQGTVEDYGGHTTEITNPSLEVTIIDTSGELPPPAVLTTEDALSSEWDGTWIQVTGTIEEIRTGAGGGTNITINDGTEDLMVRVWDVTHINLDSIIVEEIFTIRGVSAYYSGGGYYQLTPGYQEDIERGAPKGEGIGVATITPNIVDFATSNVSEKITIRSDSIGITITQIGIDIPSGWVWETPGPMGVNLSGPGFPDAAFFDTLHSDSSKIVILGASITDVNSGTLEIIDMTSPSYPGYFTFQVKTAYDNQRLELIKHSPTVFVKGVGQASLRVPPHPFAPDLGERLEIEYTAPPNNYMVLKLFDLEGRVVVTLFDGESTGGLQTFNWDGRNELFERVSIGVYILYLQATDRKSGKATTAKAPVVVATRLD